MKISFYSQPPEPIAKEIREKIKEIAKVFGKNRASNAPLPHLTLRNSINIPKRDYAEVCKTLKEELDKSNSPLVKINGWSFAPLNHKWVYGFHLKVENTKEIKNIHKRLQSLFKKYPITYKIDKFDPHISLAWNMKKEMNKEDFFKTLKYLKDQKFSFKAEYPLDKIFIHEQIGRNKFRFIKVIK